MKLYMHNFMACQSNGELVPYKINQPKTKIVIHPFKPEHFEIILKSINFFFLASACKDLGIEFVPPESADNLNESQLKVLHHILFEIEIISGEIVAPDGKSTRIANGVLTSPLPSLTSS